MASPAPLSPQSAGGAVAPVSGRTLDCSSCYEPFSHCIGPHYPRTLVPCGHTFCTQCIEKQIEARGAANFRCLTHTQPIAITKAEDAKANFALIELLEKIEKDEDHQVVDERTKPPSCSECDAASVWYCKNDDACYCDAHKISEHSNKVRSNHVIMPVADRTASVIPKCKTHKNKDLDLWCTKCSVLCCLMCERSGTHKEHADKLAPVDDVVNAQRETIARLAKEASELTADKLDKEAQMLIQLQSDFEASARRVDEEIAKQEAEMIRAVQSRYADLREEAKKQLANGLKHIAIRVDDLTLNRSRTAIVGEEATRVLRMSDYAMLAHTASVEQNAQRSRKGWEEYMRNSLVPRMMELRSEPQLLLNEIAVAGLVLVPCTKVTDGKPENLLEEPLPLSKHQQERRVAMLALLTKGLLSSCACHYCGQTYEKAPVQCTHYGNRAHQWAPCDVRTVLGVLEAIKADRFSRVD